MVVWGVSFGSNQQEKLGFLCFSHCLCEENILREQVTKKPTEKYNKRKQNTTWKLPRWLQENSHCPNTSERRCFYSFIFQGIWVIFLGRQVSTAANQLSQRKVSLHVRPIVQVQYYFRVLLQDKLSEVCIKPGCWRPVESDCQKFLESERNSAEQNTYMYTYSVYISTNRPQFHWVELKRGREKGENNFWGQNFSQKRKHSCFRSKRKNTQKTNVRQQQFSDFVYLLLNTSLQEKVRLILLTCNASFLHAEEQSYSPIKKQKSLTTFSLQWQKWKLNKSSTTKRSLGSQNAWQFFWPYMPAPCVISAGRTRLPPIPPAPLCCARWTQCHAKCDDWRKDKFHTVVFPQFRAPMRDSTSSYICNGVQQHFVQNYMDKTCISETITLRSIKSKQKQNHRQANTEKLNDFRSDVKFDKMQNILTNASFLSKKFRKSKTIEHRK